jgi:hypothetical protein
MICNIFKIILYLSLMFQQMNSKSNLFFENAYVFVSKLCIVICIKRLSFLF